MSTRRHPLIHKVCRGKEEEKPFRAGQEGILDLPPDARPPNLSRAEAWAASSYTFAQLADTQLGLMPSMRQVQWMRKLRCLVKVASCGVRDGSKEIPIPLLELPDEVVLSEFPDEDSTADQAGSDHALYEMEISLCERAVNCLNSLSPRPAFAVVCGDLVHAFPDKQPGLHARQVRDFKRVFSRVHPDIPLVCMCGNHDVGERPTTQTLNNYRNSFGKDYFSFCVGPDRYVVLNSQLYKDSSRCKEEAEAQEKWLDELLNKIMADRPRHVIVFSHHPPFLYDPDEPDAYFPLSRAVRSRLLRKLANAGVSHCFAGHYHRNAGGVYTLSPDDRAKEAVERETDRLLAGVDGDSSPGDGGTGGGGGGGSGGGAAIGKGGGRLEVVTTAAVGANITDDEQGDRLGLTGMKSVKADDRLSGFRIVQMGPGGVSHQFKSLDELCSTLNFNSGPDSIVFDDSEDEDAEEDVLHGESFSKASASAR